MFIVTALHKKIPIKLFSLNKENGLANNERIELFPTFETKEQTNEFLTNNVLLSKDVNVYIIEIGKIWGVIMTDRYFSIVFDTQKMTEKEKQAIF